MKIAICDDDKAQREYLATLVNEWAKKSGIRITLKMFADAQSFLFSWSTDKSYDALLLDIQMPELNGMELARTIRRSDESLSIIFITGFSDYMDEGYEVSALHYLMKPVKKVKLFAVLERASIKLKKESKTLLIEYDGAIIRVNQNDIICLEAFLHTIELTTADHSYQIKSSIDLLERQLDPDLFIRPHRSYLIGLHYISQIAKVEMVLDNNKHVPISRRKYTAVNQAFIRFFKGGRLH